MIYNSLDELAKDFHPGDTVFFRNTRHSGLGIRMRGTVLGYVYSLPVKDGREKEPALVLRHGGHIYPWEVERTVGMRGARVFDRTESNEAP